MTREDSKILSVSGFRVTKYANYLREKHPKLDSRAVRALLTTYEPRLMRVVDSIWNSNALNQC